MLNNEFREFIELLNKNDVEYLIVGGYAVAFHGHPRYTKDIDIWVKPEADNAHKILKALEEFGFGSLGLKVTDFLESRQIIQLGFPPNRIDLLTTITGVDFDVCFSSRDTIDLDGIEVFIIDRKNLIMNKTATARPQDLADVESLKDAD